MLRNSDSLLMKQWKLLKDFKLESDKINTTLEIAFCSEYIEDALEIAFYNEYIEDEF